MTAPNALAEDFRLDLDKQSAEEDLTLASILADFGANLFAPPAESEAMRDAKVSALLHATAYLKGELATAEQAETMELDRVRLRYQRRKDLLARQIDRLLAMCREEAERADFGGTPKKPKKSRDVGFGTYGRRLKKAAVKVVDLPRYILWASQHCPASLRATVKVSLPTLRNVLAELAQLRERYDAAGEGDHALAVFRLDGELRASTSYEVMKEPLNAWLETEGQGEEPDGTEVTPARDEPYAEPAPLVRA